MKKIFLPAFMLMGTFAFSQVGVGTPLPDNSAMLDVVATNKGALLPRVPLTSTTDALTITTGNRDGLIVFNTATAADIKPGYYYWYVNKWYSMKGAASGVGVPTGGGTAGDIYVDQSTGNVYTYNGTTWVFANNIITTLTGLNGVYTYTSENNTVTTWNAPQNGTGNPNGNGTTGTTGGIYVDNTTGNVYTYNGTTWVLANEVVTTLANTPIAPGQYTYTNEAGNPVTINVTQTGSGAPSGPAIAGDVYVDTTTGNMYTYNGTSWVIQTTGPTTNILTSASNTMTSTVDGVVANAPIINSNGLSLSGTSLTTTINGVASTPLDLTPAIQAATTNTLTATKPAGFVSTVNGVVATQAVPVGTVVDVVGFNTAGNPVNEPLGTLLTNATTNVLATAGTNLTSTVNGVASTVDITSAVQNAETLTTLANTLTAPGQYTYINEAGNPVTINITQTGSGAPSGPAVAGDVYVNTTTGDIYTYDGTTWNMVGSPDADLTNDEFINNVAANRVELGKDSDGTTNRPVGTEFVIQDDGNVGIGTSSPDQKLTVNGHVNILGVDDQSSTGIVFKDGERFIHTYGPIANENLFLGLRSGNLSLNTTNVTGADGNTGVGTDVLSSVTTGNENTGVGAGALFPLTTGTRNTAVGFVAMRAAITSGSGNTAIGTRAMQTVTTGNRNTALGDYTLRDITTGSNNTVLGSNAGSLQAVGLPLISTGSNNTLIGAYSNFETTTQYTNASAIGFRAAVGQNNSMVLGSINGINGATADTNVGIGTTTPTDRLDVNGTTRVRTLNAGASTDEVVVADATGVLKKVPASSFSTIAIRTETANYSALVADETILVDATSGVTTITLPVSAAGKKYIVKKIDASGNNVVVAATAGTIDGNVSIAGSLQWQGWIMQFDGTNWFVIGRI